MASMRNLREGRPWTLLTSTVSHNAFPHLALNMIGLYFFGGAILSVMGGANLLAVYALGGVAGSVAHIGYERYLAPVVREPVPGNVQRRKLP